MSIMSTHLVKKDANWVLISSGKACAIQVRSGPMNSHWVDYSGVLRVHIGDVQPTPTEDVPYFELQQGSLFTKATADQNLYVKMAAKFTEDPIYVTLIEY